MVSTCSGLGSFCGKPIVAPSATTQQLLFCARLGIVVALQSGLSVSCDPWYRSRRWSRPLRYLSRFRWCIGPNRKAWSPPVPVPPPFIMVAPATHERKHRAAGISLPPSAGRPT